MTPPAGARRLFAHFPSDALDLPDHEPAIVERLLEDGDGDDLRWLTATRSEAQLAAWFLDRASRRLSTRSEAFWSVVLDQVPGDRSAVQSQLWPL